MWTRLGDPQQNQHGVIPAWASNHYVPCVTEKPNRVQLELDEQACQVTNDGQHTNK